MIMEKFEDRMKKEHERANEILKNRVGSFGPAEAAKNGPKRVLVGIVLFVILFTLVFILSNGN